MVLRAEGIQPLCVGGKQAHVHTIWGRSLYSRWPCFWNYVSNGIFLHYFAVSVCYTWLESNAASWVWWMSLKHELSNLWGERHCSASLEKVAKKILLQLTTLFHIWNLLWSIFRVHTVIVVSFCGWLQEYHPLCSKVQEKSCDWLAFGSEGPYKTSFPQECRWWDSLLNVVFQISVPSLIKWLVQHVS